jgi:hypothetical protein
MNTRKLVVRQQFPNPKIRFSGFLISSHGVVRHIPDKTNQDKNEEWRMETISPKPTTPEKRIRFDV